MSTSLWRTLIVSPPRCCCSSLRCIGWKDSAGRLGRLEDGQAGRETGARQGAPAASWDVLFELREWAGPCALKLSACFADSMKLKICGKGGQCRGWGPSSWQITFKGPHVTEDWRRASRRLRGRGKNIKVHALTPDPLACFLVAMAFGWEDVPCGASLHQGDGTLPQRDGTFH